MVKVCKSGNREQDMREKSLMVESKELENILTQKDVFMKVDLMIIILMVKEYLNGEMEEFIKVIGSMEECMDMEFIFGLMETVMKVIIMKARKMV